MRAVWYENFGAASDVLTIGEMADPVPGAGEVLVRVHASGVNPSDVKLRAGARPGAVMEFARIIPHSDGAGVIKAVGSGVDPARIGQRVWLWNGQWKRAYGTCGELIALPADQAVVLPDGTSFGQGACFGVPAMTAWYAVLGAGPVDGKTVLVTGGGAGTVGRYACQMARLGGARVITTVSSTEKAAHAGAEEWVNYRDANVTEAVMEMTGAQGVDLIVDVDFGTNQADSLALIRTGGVIASYASAAVMRPELEFYGFMFKNITLRMLIVYLMPDAARRRGEAQLNGWLDSGALSHAVVAVHGMDQVAAAHDKVASGGKLGSVVVEF